MKNLTRNQKLGTVSVCIGLIVFLPLLFLAVGEQYWIDGENVTHIFRAERAEFGMTLGLSFLNTLSYFGIDGRLFWFVIAQLGTLALVISSIAFVTTGILLLFGKADKLELWIKRAVMIVGITMVVVAIFSIINIIALDSIDLGGVEHRFVLGFGSILMLLVGAAVICLSVFWDKSMQFIDGLGQTQTTETSKEKADKKPVASQKPVTEKKQENTKKVATDKKGE